MEQTRVSSAYFRELNAGADLIVTAAGLSADPDKEIK
jgi:hypothetical protein